MNLSYDEIKEIVSSSKTGYGCIYFFYCKFCKFNIFTNNKIDIEYYPICEGCVSRICSDHTCICETCDISFCKDCVDSYLIQCSYCVSQICKEDCISCKKCGNFSCENCGIICECEDE